MTEQNVNEDMTESDNITALELQRTKRVLYFSDGCVEEFTDDEVEDSLDTTDRGMEVDIDVKSLPLLNQIRYQAYQVGSKLLNGIDYVGGGLANFLGITTPKYISESEIDAVCQNLPEKECDEGNSVSWKHNNNTPNMVITRYPDVQ